jgi:hypothetical protein
MRSYVTTDGQSVLVSSSHLRPKKRILLLLDICGFFDVGRPLWWEDGAVVYNFCWSSPTKLFSGSTSTELMTVFYCLRFKTPSTWRARCPYLYPLETGGPVILPGPGCPFRRPLWLAGIRRRYSTSPPHGILNYSCFNFPHGNGANQARMNRVGVAKYTILPRFIFICKLLGDIKLLVRSVLRVNRHVLTIAVYEISDDSEGRFYPNRTYVRF